MQSVRLTACLFDFFYYALRGSRLTRIIFSAGAENCILYIKTTFVIIKD